MAFNNIPPNGFPALPDIENLEAVEKDVTTLKTSVAGLTQDVTDLKSGLTEVNNIIIDRKNVVSGDKIPWVNFASGLIIWSAAGMASGSGILFVGADNTAITYTSLSHGGNVDISASDFDFANGELEFKRGFIQVVIVKLTNA